MGLNHLRSWWQAKRCVRTWPAGSARPSRSSSQVQLPMAAAWVHALTLSPEVLRCATGQRSRRQVRCPVRVRALGSVDGGSGLAPGCTGRDTAGATDRLGDKLGCQILPETSYHIKTMNRIE